MNEQSIFIEALERDPAERAEYVAQACGDNDALRKRVEILLRAHGNAGNLLERPAAESTNTLDRRLVPVPLGTVIDRYKLLQQIGEGGFGVVYMAEQLQSVRRKVALKVIKPGMDTRAVVARFEAERQALALMDHPNIARVFDGGATKSGRPYFVMELVKGVPLTEFCDANSLPAAERIALFVTVCQAVHHAHQKGIIHRDLKPSNILVTLADGKPVVKVIDFGVSKALNQQLTEKTLFTAYGQMIGTPQYMSPEQAEMSCLDVDTRSDVYSLGVLLYELLTGTTPLEAERLRAAGYAEVQRLIREEEPPKPSMRLSTSGEKLTFIAKHRGADPERLQRMVRGELDWIVMKSLEKERSRRYDSPSHLAGDVERFLAGEPVEAHPPSLVYRLRKFIRRNRLQAVAASAVLVAILLGVAGISIAWLQSLKSQAVLEERLYRYGTSLAYQALNEQNRVQLEHLLPSLLPGDAPAFELRYLWARHQELRDPANVREIPVPASVVKLDYSPDGRYLAIGCANKEVLLYDTEQARFVSLPEGLQGSHPTISPRSTYLAVCFSPTPDQAVSTRDVQSPRIIELATLKVIDGTGWKNISVSALAFSPDETTIACVSPDGTLEIRECPSGRLLRSTVVNPDTVLSHVAWSPDGRLVAVSDLNTVVSLWDAERCVRIAGFSPNEYHHVAFSPDSKRLLIGGAFGGMLWEIQGEKLVDSGQEIRDDITCACFDPLGRWLALGSADYKIRIRDARGLKPVHQLLQREYVGYIAFSPDGKYLAAGGREKVVRLWNTRVIGAEEKCQGLRHFHPPLAVSSGELVATCHEADDECVLKLWHASNQHEQTVAHLQQKITALAFSSDGKRLASGSEDGSCRLWDLKTGELERELPRQEGKFRSLAFSPDGRFLVAGLDPSGAYLCDLQTYLVRPLKGHADGVAIQCVTYSSDGQLATSGGKWHDYGETVLWQPQGDELTVKKRILHPRIVRCMAFSPSGREIAVTHDFSAGDIRFFDTTTGELRQSLRGHSSKTMAIAFTPDGRRLVSGSDDRTIRFWDVASGELVGTLQVNERVRKLSFLPGGNGFVTASWEGWVRVRRAADPSDIPRRDGHW